MYIITSKPREIEIISGQKTSKPKLAIFWRIIKSTSRMKSYFGLYLFYFHRLLLTWSWAGLHCGQLSIYMASLVFKYSQKIPNTLVRTLFLSAAGKQARKY